MNEIHGDDAGHLIDSLRDVQTSNYVSTPDVLYFDVWHLIVRGGGGSAVVALDDDDPLWEQHSGGEGHSGIEWGDGHLVRVRGANLAQVGHPAAPIEMFKFSIDPDLEPKMCDVVGLYLAPPDGAVVVSVDEKSQVQALNRTAPMLPLRPGLAARRTHDYKRHGTTTLFAALEIATGKITADACYPRHRHQEFLRFLKKVAAVHLGVELHVVLDNYATHKHPDVRKWLAKPENQRITRHFTPTGCSWLTWWRSSSGSSPARPSAAAPSPPSKTSPPPSAPSSTPTTTAVTHSPGPKTPTNCSPKSNLQRTNATRH
jgi:hypothetical protein